ncbi:DUF3060 domain-containing protein [Mycolicibacterium palauense]|uniref:DUF3060 domain-containing protein n=1 Tax=Mycolicibacterium palauense TaxID=2034511 RepID=UPI001146089D|nr:DUF3060 domain-containing protein [Mycolicibacterium palauense]
MESDDDPEAYIRELERPLTDAARASELGLTPPHGNASVPPVPTGHVPPMPSPWYSEGPYPMPPASPSPRAPRRGPLVLLIIGVIAAAGLIGVVALASSVRDIFSGARSALESPEGPASPAPAPPGRDSGIAPVPVPVLPAGPQAPGAGSPVALPPGGEFSLGGVGENRTLVCNDGVVRVSGVSNTVEIGGHCLRVEVSGIQNIITVDSADEISASGFDNRVDYRSGTPRVQRAGQGNSVEQR